MNSRCFGVYLGLLKQKTRSSFLFFLKKKKKIVLVNQTYISRFYVFIKTSKRTLTQKTSKNILTFKMKLLTCFLNILLLLRIGTLTQKKVATSPLPQFNVRFTVKAAMVTLLDFRGFFIYSLPFCHFYPTCPFPILYFLYFFYIYKMFFQTIWIPHSCQVRYNTSTT